MAKNYKVVFDEVVTLPGVGIDVNPDFGKIGTGYKDGDEVNNAGQVQIFGYVEDALANTFTSDSSSTCPTFVGYTLLAPPAGATNIRKLSDVIFDGVEFKNVEADRNMLGL